jgi:hypothetical protein
MEVKYFPENEECSQSMVTTWFEMPAGSSVQVEYRVCSEVGMNFVVFGNISKKNSSPQFAKKDKMLIEVFDFDGDLVGSSSTRVQLVGLEDGVYTCRYTNDHKKDQRLRLRASVV